MKYARCALVFAAACSYTRPADVGGDGGHLLDVGSGSGSGSGSGTGSGACTAAAMYGTPTFTETTNKAFNVAAAGVTPRFTYWQGDLDATNIASVQVTAGVDPFAGEPMPGAFQLGGDTNLMTCGLCVAVATYDSNRSGFISYYVATAGTFTLMTVPPPEGSGEFAGTLDNATFTHVVTTDGEPTATLDPSCKTSIDHLVFDLTANDN